MHRTIRFRIALLISGLMLIVLVGFGVFIYASLSTQLFNSLDASLRLSAEQILPTMENENGHLVFGRGDIQSVNVIDQDELLRLVTPQGEIIDARGLSNTITIPAASISGGGGFFTISSPGNEQSNQSEAQNEQQNHQDDMRLLSVPVVAQGQIIAYLQIGRSLEPIQDTLDRLLVLLLVAGPVMLAITAVSGYWLAGRALAPIERIRKQAAAIGADDLSQRLATGLPDDEVGRLARTFDQMLARLDESFRRQRRFVADASHELRTPLAIIRGEVDVTLERSRSTDTYQEVLQSVGSETERMTRLVSDLLLLARSDNAELEMHMELLDLAGLLSATVEQLEPQAEQAGVVLEAHLQDPLPVMGDSDRLLQLFINLLDNAITYAPDSTVSVLGRSHDGMVEVQVSDTGPGISPEHLPHLFERFYRVDKARSRESGGSGLGLAITQEIARAHNGDITVTSELGQGTTFTVRLPLRLPLST